MTKEMFLSHTLVMDEVIANGLLDDKVFIIKLSMVCTPSEALSKYMFLPHTLVGMH